MFSQVHKLPLRISSSSSKTSLAIYRFFSVHVHLFWTKPQHTCRDIDELQNTHFGMILDNDQPLSVLVTLSLAVCTGLHVSTNQMLHVSSNQMLHVSSSQTSLVTTSQRGLWVLISGGNQIKTGTDRPTDLWGIFWPDHIVYEQKETC